MEFTTQKINIKNSIKILLNSDLIDDRYINCSNEVINDLKSLLNDIENDKYVVVVVGEFKRGKSTFINALINNDLLPADVLPETATINVLEYSDKPFVEVYTKDNKVYRGNFSKEFLKKFSADNDRCLIENTKFIKIGVNADILKDNFVIVDTPGVDDLNIQRCDITYSYLPNANAVLFLLDANSPLKATEKEFIDTRIYPLGLRNIIFILNKYDCIDDEEDENLIEDVKCRLENSLEGAIGSVRLYPLSARLAMRGLLNNDQSLVSLSGINEIKEAFIELAFNGDIEEQKVDRFTARFKDIVVRIYNEYSNEVSVKNQSLDELRQLKLSIESVIKVQEQDKDKITIFVDDEIANIFLMVDKSLNYFHESILKNIVENVKLYKGHDFKDYVEQRLSKMLQREMENWVATYSVHIDQLLRSVEKEIAYGISCKFRQNVSFKSQFYMNDKMAFNFDLTSEDVSTARFNAGVIAAGGAGLLMLIGAPMLMPFISMAAFPFLQEKFLNEKLQQAKAKIVPEIEEQIAEYIIEVRDSMHSYIMEQCCILVKNGEELYDNMLIDLKIRVDEEIMKKEKIGASINQEVDTINSNMTRLLDLVKHL